MDTKVVCNSRFNYCGTLSRLTEIASALQKWPTKKDLFNRVFPFLFILQTSLS